LLHKTIAALAILCNKRPMRQRQSQRSSRPLRGQLRLALGVPKNHSVREEYRRCGAEGCRTCQDGLGHGPYRYAVWREGAKVKRKYLGKA
jgi:hypothetical protein